MDRVNFITENPVVQGMRQAQQMDTERSRGQLLDMQVDGAKARAREERAATDALNRIYARGGQQSSVDVQRQLAADPNIGGTRRLQALQQSEEADRQRTQVEAQARERDARTFKMYLENGLDAAAAEQARKMGIVIPPQFWADKEKRTALIQQLEIDEKRARIGQSQAAAGASRALAEERRKGSAKEYTDHENRVVREHGGASSYVIGPDGQPLRTAPKGGADGGRPSVYQERYQAWLKTNPGDEAGALRYAASERESTVAEKVKSAIEYAKAQSVIDPGKYDSEYRKALQSYGLDPDDVYGTKARAARPQGQQQGGPTPDRPAQPMPLDAGGLPDRAKLIPGEIYLVEDPVKGGQKFGRWNPTGGKKGNGGFEVVP